MISMKRVIRLKHAILVEGHGENANVLQGTINVLDDDDIDFWIHWDKKNKEPILTSKKSKIKFIKQRTNMWGSDSQILVEKQLLEAVSGLNYDYVHLISSSDIPLMSRDHFKSFFTKEVYIGFYSDPNISDRVKYYYPLRHINLRSEPLIIKKLFLKAIIVSQKLLHVNRLKSSDVVLKKGISWFSMKGEYVKEILNVDEAILMHSVSGDELYVQTVLR